ncbi:MAG: steroid 5-alpha reductase family enzyme [Saprospiraceae bacterium]|jgi:steroid 5-alpha reductase family enzyme
MKYFKPLFIFLIGWIILLLSQSISQLSTINGIIQLLLFGLVVCWPIWKTGRLSYVDIGWPWGLVCIGLLTLIFSDGYYWRVRIIAGIYIFIGLRMGLGALQLWRKGYMQKEFPRYQYQRGRWERAGKTNVSLAMQVDALAQGLANASFLALPAFVIGWNPDPTFSIFEIIGLVIWILAFIMEATADAQKLSFLRKMSSLGKKNKVCDIGLWNYTRHPNYFAEWMVWNAIIIAAIPSWIRLRSEESLLIWVLLGLALLFVSRVMYLSLVYLTGAIPSEYYSLKKRPDYKAYKERVNMFFPGFPK